MKIPRKRNVTIKVVIATKKYRISAHSIEKIARVTLTRCGIRSGLLNIYLVGNRTIRRLNKTYKRRNAATDVLAFPIGEEIPTRSHGMVCLMGEVVISLDQAKVQAGRFHTTFRQEVILYVIHGILHILGYDDIKNKDRQRMEKKQHELLAAITRRVKRT
ncbi:MAG: rRNA maturation RNase YbeY [Candidatus Omnitrophica bacterium]|nr:rRNA maturation RNase YbeY [Candidatus Omnitrophota bacterium]